ncbi:MAG TPA: N-acetylmuramoyl-L-alanine amidase [Gemmatimonadaceae bacterium]|nr:N-acetylmuramoyl-L-alanine amidase [Gemmatimonadaceae bacterium]
MMLCAFIAAMQFAAADPRVLTVRAGDREAFVPIVEATSGPAIQARLLDPIIPMRITEAGAGRYTVAVGGLSVTVLLESPYLEHGGKIYPLVTPPFIDGGELYLPLQMFTEYVAKLAPAAFKYTTVTRELHYAAAVRLSAPAVASASPRSPPAVRNSAEATPPRTSTSPPRRVTRRVVVDAGHGGPDNGMTGPIGSRSKVAEKTITLAVAKQLRDALTARGVEVIMTRTSDTLIALHDRGRIANQKSGDLFISIHVNGPNMRWRNPQSVRGFETFFLAEAKTEEEQRVADMENASVRFETAAEASKGDPLSFIIADMAQNEHLRESLELATLIQGEIATFHPGTNRGVKQANFAVLRTSYMPAVLVEIGFGSNAEESRFMTTPARQKQIAIAIADAAVAYLANYERRVGGAP